MVGVLLSLACAGLSSWDESAGLGLQLIALTGSPLSAHPPDIAIAGRGALMEEVEQVLLHVMPKGIPEHRIYLSTA
jgi:hypothetical protein